jgi:hypothetical protein
MSNAIGKIAKCDLYRVYTKWCGNEGFKPVNQRALKESLRQLFPTLDEWRKEGGKGPWHWVGISLTADAPSVDTDEPTSFNPIVKIDKWKQPR